MTIRTEELAGGITKVILEGRLDIENSPAVDLRMSAIAGGRNSVLVDLQNVSFLGSMGLRSLVAPALVIRGRGGKMVLFGPNELIKKVLKVSGIETMIPVHHELQSALAALQ
jgi:anti-sigma B factor antagonist